MVGDDHGGAFIGEKFSFLFFGVTFKREVNGFLLQKRYKSNILNDFGCTYSYVKSFCSFHEAQHTRVSIKPKAVVGTWA